MERSKPIDDVAIAQVAEEATPRRRPRAIAAGALLCIAIAGFLVLPDRGGLSDGSPVNAEVDTIYPVESVEDLVAYGDAIAVVTVRSEVAGEASESEGGSYTIPRSVEVVVDDVLWRTPFADRPTLADGAELTLGSNGWMVSDRTRHPIVVEPGAFETVGNSYVVALVYHESGEVEQWQRMGPQVVLEIVGGKVQLPGGPLQDVEALPTYLDSVPIAPLASAHGDLPPLERYHAVGRDLTESDPSEDPAESTTAED